MNPTLGQNGQLNDHGNKVLNFCLAENLPNLLRDAELKNLNKIKTVSQI